MSVPEQVPYKEYRATGSNNSFEITFYLPDPKDLVVMVNKEIPLVGAYSIQGNTVVFNKAPEEGDLIELTRDTQLDRETSFKSYDNSFRPETINFDLDKIWLVLQESNLVDAKILARLKQEIEWRRTHDFNYDELAQVREKQLFDALKGYTDTLNAATNPGVFQGVIAGVVFAQDGKSIQTHLEEILEALAQERENIDSKADQTYVEEQLDLKANQDTTYSKTEVDSALDQKANQSTTYTKSEVDSVVAPLTGGHKGYTTLALAQAAQASLPANVIIEVTNDGANNGTYQWNGTTLTKSTYDPLTQANKNTRSQISMLPKYSSEFEQHEQVFNADMTPNRNSSAGVSEEIISGKRYYTVTSGTNERYAGYNIKFNPKRNDLLNISISNVISTSDRFVLRLTLLNEANQTLYLKDHPFTTSDDTYAINLTDLEIPDGARFVRFTFFMGPNASTVLKFCNEYISVNLSSPKAIDKFVSEEIDTKIAQYDLTNPASQLINQGYVNDFEHFDFTPFDAQFVSYSKDQYDKDAYNISIISTRENALVFVTYRTAVIEKTITIDLKNVSSSDPALFLRIRGESASGGFVLTEEVSPTLNINGTYDFLDTLTLPETAEYLRISFIFSSAGAEVSFVSTDFKLLVYRIDSITDSVKKLAISANTPIIEALENELIDLIEPNTFRLAVESGKLVQKGGCIVDTKVNASHISWWGSSTISNLSSNLTAMATTLGISKIFNGGKGGEQVEDHAARMGAVPARCVIPSSVIGETTTQVNVLNFYRSRNQLKPYTGFLNGVHGTLSYNSSTSPNYLFTRTSAGSEVSVSATDEYEFIPDLDDNFLGGIVIINAGKNTLTSGLSAEYVFDYTVKMYEHLTPLFKRCLIINHYPNSTSTESVLTQIKRYNSLLLQRFGDLVIDNHGYVVSEQVWSDTGITPTPEDLAQQLAGKIPQSLTTDGAHMISALNAKVVDKLVKPKIEALWL